MDKILRRKSRQVMVGKVAVGGDAPISVQSMTNTLTSDAKATIAQIEQQAKVGCDITRCSCPDEDSAKAMKEITKSVSIPVVADIHFDYKLALIAADNGAACLRINPGNIGGIDRVKEVIKAAKANNCSIRIGVNGGSLDKKLLEKYGEPCAVTTVNCNVWCSQIGALLNTVSIVGAGLTVTNTESLSEIQPSTETQT